VTFTTAAFDRSSSRLFEALSYKTAPRGPPSSLVQHDALASLDTTSLTTVHAGPHTAVRRVELGVYSQAFCIVRRQEAIRSLPGRTSGLHPNLPPEGQTILAFLPPVVPEIALPPPLFPLRGTVRAFLHCSGVS
jgi:hypothetical protein